MQNLAYQLDFTLEDQRTVATPNTTQDNTDLCPVCGHELFGPDAEACSWQSWGTFWEILGVSNVELVCGTCGEYLREFFHADRK